MAKLYRHKLVISRAKINGLRSEAHNALDLVGHKYGMVLVQNCVGKDKRQNKLWRCICDCGNTSIATTGNLRSGNTKSCGCKKKEACIISSTRQRNTSISQLAERLALLPNPFSVGDAASIIFAGDRSRASKWICENTKSNHLKKIKRGVYEKNQ